jgi:hypothetical protein
MKDVVVPISCLENINCQAVPSYYDVLVVQLDSVVLDFVWLNF